MQNGAGAAGTAIIHMLQVAGAKHIIARATSTASWSRAAPLGMEGLQG